MNHLNPQRKTDKQKSECFLVASHTDSIKQKSAAHYIQNVFCSDVLPARLRMRKASRWSRDSSAIVCGACLIRAGTIDGDFETSWSSSPQTCRGRDVNRSKHAFWRMLVKDQKCADAFREIVSGSNGGCRRTSSALCS